MTNLATPTVWIYPPSADLMGWDEPVPFEDEAPTMADAHEYARRLRQLWPGHLVAVTNGKPPLFAVTDGRKPKPTCHPNTPAQADE